MAEWVETDQCPPGAGGFLRQYNARYGGGDLQTGKDATGHISLRSAIMAANAQPGADSILVPNGTFRLTVAGTGEDAAARGDLDILSQ